MSFNKQAFTLIELLIVIAIVAVLAVTILLTLNPAQLMKQARDSSRLTDMASLHTALSAYQASGGTALGSSSVVYVSLPDTSASCANHQLPSLPTGWTYACRTTSTYTKADGTGWIPVNLSSQEIGSPFTQLPIDPTNTASNGRYYAYTVSSTRYALSAVPESGKFALGGSSDVASLDGGMFPELIERGSDLALHPVSRDPNLVGYWSFNEGSGATTFDVSGARSTGTLMNSPTWLTGTNCKQGTCLSFDGINDYITLGTRDLGITQDVSVAFWMNPAAPRGEIANSSWIYATLESGWIVHLGNNNHCPNVTTGTISWGSSDNTGNYNCTALVATNASAVTVGQWHHVVVAKSGTAVTIFLNGSPVATGTVAVAPILPSAGVLSIGMPSQTPYNDAYYSGILDELRIYNRTLIAAEVAALYSSSR